MPLKPTHLDREDVFRDGQLAESTDRPVMFIGEGKRSDGRAIYSYLSEGGELFFTFRPLPAIKDAARRFALKTLVDYGGPAAATHRAVTDSARLIVAVLNNRLECGHEWSISTHPSGILTTRHRCKRKRGHSGRHACKYKYRGTRMEAICHARTQA